MKDTDIKELVSHPAIMRPTTLEIILQRNGFGVGERINVNFWLNQGRIPARWFNELMQCPEINCLELGEQGDKAKLLQQGIKAIKKIGRERLKEAGYKLPLIYVWEKKGVGQSHVVDVAKKFGLLPSDLRPDYGYFRFEEIE